MGRETKRLTEFRKWFDKYISKGFGKRCQDFAWDCAACRAYFVKMVFDDFVSDTAATEKWVKRRGK